MVDTVGTQTVTRSMPVLENDEQSLYDLIPADGKAIGNRTLIRDLEWDPDHYYTVRDRLVDTGLIRLWVGAGGTVRRVVDQIAPIELEPELSQSDRDDAVERLRESELYLPMLSVLKGEWSKANRIEPLVADITAHGGRRADGTWSRPDIVLVQVHNFLHVPGKHLDIMTFEVKPSDAISVTAVYEALSHRRSATHSYVVLHAPDLEQQEPQVAEVCEVAHAHGIGVIVVGDPSDHETWDTRIVSQRHEPDPARLDHFISSQLPPDARTKIQRMVS